MGDAELHLERMIKAPINAVFDKLADIESINEWQPHKGSIRRRSRKTSQGPVGLGTTYEDSTLFGKAPGEVSAFDQPARARVPLAAEGAVGRAPGRGLAGLLARGGGGGRDARPPLRAAADVRPLRPRDAGDEAHRPARADRGARRAREVFRLDRATENLRRDCDLAAGPAAATSPSIGKFVDPDSKDMCMRTRLKAAIAVLVTALTLGAMTTTPAAAVTGGTPDGEAHPNVA